MNLHNFISSKELAAITGQSHATVKRTISRLVREMVIYDAIVQNRRIPGKTAEHKEQTWALLENDSYTVVAMLAPEAVRALRDRWVHVEKCLKRIEELEAEATAARAVLAEAQEVVMRRPKTDLDALH